MVLKSTIMVHIDSFKVRFGDLGFGQLTHPATFFDWLIISTEELSYEIGYTTDEIVDAGGVPYAPVATWGNLERYPRYDDTVKVTAEPVEISERSFRCEYRFTRADDGVSFGRSQIVHVTITPEGASEPIPPASHEQLLKFQNESVPAPIEINPEPPVIGTPAIDREVVFRTPHLEAADLGYFEEFVRFLTIALEEYLDELGLSLRAYSKPVYPFLIKGWKLTFAKSIEFEDRIRIKGEFSEVASDKVRVDYAFEGAVDGETRIVANVTYGCYNESGSQVSFPDDLIDKLQ